ncbi:hypothetical protein [Kitasatospora sp. NPDC001527]|uniref:hypothetical protein n=1 Tax=Kitasatospora sp. NPDC001527 TaxID=3154519 RepID=UPI003323D3E9
MPMFETVPGERAALALATYNDRAPDDVLALSVGERIQHGTAALQAATGPRRFVAAQQARRDFCALVADLFHLTGDRITSTQLWFAAREIMTTTPPGEKFVRYSLAMLQAMRLDQCAALLAALVEAAQAHGIEPDELFVAARALFTAEVELSEHHAAA